MFATQNRMTRSTKIVLSIVGVSGAALLAAGTLAAYYILSVSQGTKLANEAYEACLRGNYEDAITKYTAALQTRLPSYQKSYAYLNRGYAYNAKWRLDDAIRDFTVSIEFNPKVADAYTNRGLAYQRKGDNDKAIADFTKAIELDPNAASAYYDRGLIFFGKGEWDKAIPDFDEAVRSNPANADALVNRGICYVNKNDLEHALASFDGAIAIDPNNAGAFSERATIYTQKKEWKKNARDSAEAQRLTPASATGQAQVQLRVSKNRPEERQVDSGYLLKHIEAMAAYEQGQFDHAIDLNNILLAMNIVPAEASSAVMNRGNAYRAKHDWDRALRDYEEAIKLNPKNAGAYVDRASVLWHYGEHDDAIKDLDEAVRINPNSGKHISIAAATFVIPKNSIKRSRILRKRFN
jgi:tetratricopeptide (TPR) repeat protein